MNKKELINFLKTNVNNKGDLGRDVVIVTCKKQRCLAFNLMYYGKSKTKIGYYDAEFKIYNCVQEINDLGEFIDILDKEYNILYVMNMIDKKPYHYNNVDLDNIMVLNEAAEVWNVRESNIRYHISTEKLVSGIEYRKAGRITLITKKAMIKLFGDAPREENK